VIFQLSPAGRQWLVRRQEKIAESNRQFHIKGATVINWVSDAWKKRPAIKTAILEMMPHDSRHTRWTCMCDLNCRIKPNLLSVTSKPMVKIRVRTITVTSEAARAFEHLALVADIGASQIIDRSPFAFRQPIVELTEKVGQLGGIGLYAQGL
jgi:hypothetical protein